MTEAPGRRARRILVILHQETSSPGRVGQMLAAKGFELDMRRPVFGEKLPTTLAGHAGAVIFGGPMSANDREPFISREIDWLKVPLEENKPFLGICLGAQMLVRHLGGVVSTPPGGNAEIGWYPLESTVAGRALFDWPSMVYQFHREGFELPAGAALLARGAGTYPNQAFRYGERAWGLQFHAELTQMMMQKWVVHGASRFELPGAQAGRAHLEGRMRYDAPLRRWLSEFLDHVFQPEPALVIERT